ncbi:MAG TPA: response regulator transcription factor [Candidatus Dormibacteraeota bacterium]|nr:response regulator transcription factor [Candidatus Dormibacteraeota bacterium]
MIRVLAVDNSRIHTCLLADSLSHDAELEVIRFEADSSRLVETAIAQGVHVLVVSATLDEQPSRGHELVRQLRSLRPDIRAVLLLDSSKDEAVLKAFRSGARGVFGRNQPIELLSKCVRCVHEGQIWANSHDLGIAMQALADSPTVRAVNAEGMSLLSERELQVVRCLSEGLTNREIAERMELSQHTIKNYLFRVFDKLGVSSRVELLFMTLSQGSAEQGSLPRASKEDSDSGSHSRDEFEMLEKSAASGLPAAQLALAQLHLARRRDPQDLVDGCMWHMVAIERALQARELITRMMTPQQVEEAKQKATMWLSRTSRDGRFAANNPGRPPAPAPSDELGIEPD